MACSSKNEDSSVDDTDSNENYWCERWTNGERQRECIKICDKTDSIVKTACHFGCDFWSKCTGTKWERDCGQPVSAIYSNSQRTDKPYKVSSTVMPANWAGGTTLNAWIKRSKSGVDPYMAGIIYSRSSGTATGISLTNGGQLSVTYYLQFHGADTGLYPEQDEWVFVAFTASVRGTGVLYMSTPGEENLQTYEFPGTLSDQPTVINVPFWVGKDSGVSNRIFNGDIKDVGIYDRVLSLEELERTLVRAQWIYLCHNLLFNSSDIYFLIVYQIIRPSLSTLLAMILFVRHVLYPIIHLQAVSLNSSQVGPYYSMAQCELYHPIFSLLTDQFDSNLQVSNCCSNNKPSNLF